MSLADEHAAAAFEQQLEFFGEDVVYRPAAVGAAARTIKAIVHREHAQSVGNGRGSAPKISIQVMHHATLGVTSIDKGQADAFEVAEDLGGTRQKRAALTAVRESAGWLIKLR